MKYSQMVNSKNCIEKQWNKENDETEEVEQVETEVIECEIEWPIAEHSIKTHHVIDERLLLTVNQEDIRRKIIEPINNIKITFQKNLRNLKLIPKIMTTIMQYYDILRNKLNQLLYNSVVVLTN